MTMHPELKHALDTGVSIPKVIEIFVKHHCGPKEKVKPYRHNPAFWDQWNPLFRRLGVFEAGFCSPEISGPLLSIHRALTKDVISWLCDSKRRNNVYLIAEPFTKKGSALGYQRAAVFANICSAAQRFGRLFPHMGQKCFNIYSLIAELGAVYPPYSRILTQILINNPGIGDLPLRTVFKKLLYQPLKVVQHSHPEYVTTPPVVVLRWDPRTQSELFRLICELDSPSLLWIISVDLRFGLPIQDLVDPLAPLRYIRLPVCYDEASADATLILHLRFAAIRRKYIGMFHAGEVWPSEEQISQLARIVSGVFEFVDVIVQFVDWADDGGPRWHLETFLGYMVNSPSPSDEQRYSALDHFYSRALSSIPPDLLSDVKKAFSIVRCLEHEMDGLGVNIRLSHLLSLVSPRHDTFLPYLERLAVVSDHGFLHKSSCTRYFRHFIEDPNRSGQFYTPKSESCLQSFQVWLHFLSRSSDLSTILKPPGARLFQAKREVSCWQFLDLRRLAWLALQHRGITKIAQAERASLLRQFDFRCLAQICDNITIEQFCSFVKNLYEWDEANSPRIVRIKPANSLDRQFIEKCEGLAEPWNIEDKSTQHLTGPEYVLIGYEAETLLAVIASRKEHDESMNLPLPPDRSGVTIYTSAMLDYM